MAAWFSGLVNTVAGAAQYQCIADDVCPSLWTYPLFQPFD
jgi:hypothetical protein